MGINTKPNLSSDKFEQFSGDTLNLSGLTRIFGSIEYGGNAPLILNNNSLVHKGYVTGLTSSLIITANNGLTKSGNNIRLGGNLTGNTFINGLSNNFNLAFTTGKFQISGSTWNYMWDTQNKRLLAGNNCQVTGGSINYTFGDDNINAGIFGSVIFGELSEIAPNVGSAMIVGEGGYISSYGGKSFGRGTKINTGGLYGFIGGGWIPGFIYGKTSLKVPQVNGMFGFGWYATDNNQSNNHGANASYSAILGGINHNIPSNSTSSVVIGGNGIKALSADTDTVYLPKVRIGQGIGGALTSGSTSNNLLTRGVNGIIETRTITSVFNEYDETMVNLGTGSTGTITLDLSKKNFMIVLTGTVTIDHTNLVANREYRLWIERSTNTTITWATNKWKAPLGQAPSLTNPTTNGSSPAKAVDCLTFISRGVDNRPTIVITPDSQNI